MLMKLCLPCAPSRWKVFRIPQVQSQCILDIVIHQSPPILQPLVIAKQPLLSRKDAFILLDLSLDIADSIRAHHLELDDNMAHPVLKGDLCNENDFEEKTLQTNLCQGTNLATKPGRKGEKQTCFSQFCEVGGLAILKKRK